jgi:hypothetical protein
LRPEAGHQKQAERQEDEKDEQAAGKETPFHIILLLGSNSDGRKRAEFVCH